MLIRVFLVFTITLLSFSFGADAQTKSTTPTEPSKIDRNVDTKARLQRNLHRNSTVASRYNPAMSQKAFSDLMADTNKDVFVVNGYELQFTSNLALEGGQSVASIILYASGEKFGEVMFLGRDEAVESIQERMGKRESLEKGEPLVIAYHIDMLPNILTFLESSRSVAVVLDKTSKRVSLSTGQVSMWERR